jgi:hypothetical protein
MNKVKPKKRERETGTCVEATGFKTEQAAAAGGQTDSGVINHQTDK